MLHMSMGRLGSDRLHPQCLRTLKAQSPQPNVCCYCCSSTVIPGRPGMPAIGFNHLTMNPHMQSYFLRSKRKSIFKPTYWYSVKLQKLMSMYTIDPNQSHDFHPTVLLSWLALITECYYEKVVNGSNIRSKNHIAISHQQKQITFCNDCLPLIITT